MALVYYISSDRIGNQDAELGQKLMHSFFIKLLEASPKPSHILFLESGVRLLLPSFSAVDALKILESEMGVELLACQTCLNHYGIKDRICLGKVSNMPEIIRIMHEADKVIKL